MNIYNAEQLITCPFCGQNYTHIDGYTWIDGYGADGPSRFRQGHLALAVHCEQYPDKHRWSYIFGEHKGQVTFVLEESHLQGGNDDA